MPLSTPEVLLKEVSFGSSGEKEQFRDKPQTENIGKEEEKDKEKEKDMKMEMEINQEVDKKKK
jgi:hypothetical protein